MRLTLTIAAAGSLVCAAGCHGLSGETIAERRAYVQVMRDTTLADLETQVPGTAARLEHVPGWAVFSTVGARMFMSGRGDALGIAHDTRTGAETYMRMTESGVDPRVGPDEFRAVFVFSDEQSFRRFVEQGRGIGGDGVPGAGPVLGVSIYEFDGGELSSRSSVAGTKYSKDEDLNSR